MGHLRLLRNIRLFGYVGKPTSPDEGKLPSRRLVGLSRMLTQFPPVTLQLTLQIGTRPSTRLVAFHLHSQLVTNKQVTNGNTSRILSVN